MNMLNFTEYAWDRAVTEYAEACATAGIDPKEALYNELFGGLKRLFGGGQQQEPQQDPVAAMQQQRSIVPPLNRPKDNGILMPTDKGARGFGDNAGYARVIGQEIQKGIPGLLRNVYTSFRQQHPNHDDEKVKAFFNGVSKKLSASAAEIMNKSTTDVDGSRMPVSDPRMNAASAKARTPTNGPPPMPGQTQAIPALAGQTEMPGSNGLKKPLVSKRGSARVDI